MPRCSARGIVGDREWAVYTADGGHRQRQVQQAVPPGRRAARLPGHPGTGNAVSRRRLPAGAVPLIESPSGQRWQADDPQAAEQLSAQLGQPLRLDS